MVEDFEKLKQAGKTGLRLSSDAQLRRVTLLGVDMNGKIAMVRYGGNFRGLKVKAAQDAGAAGTASSLCQCSI